MDIYRPVVEAREHLRGRGYPQELARWWEESIEASDSGKKLDRDTWREIWNTEKPEQRLSQLRSRYIESVLSSM